ncbi:MAG: hypothetical protein IJV43_05975 [Oscillospiraceae bacterium]|nr:hypothetical protein [Oscillospiraceae bacterium]
MDIQGIGNAYTSALPQAAPPSKQTADTTTTNTDQVDRELEQLRAKKQQAEQRLRTENDPYKRLALEEQLRQVERELSAKDNDAYRRRRAVVS